MTCRHILSIADLPPAELFSIVQRSAGIASGKFCPTSALRGKAVGIYFRQTSTRTRTSFTVAAAQLGASTVSYGPHDLQTNTGETVEDTARVLAGFLDILVIRTATSAEEPRVFAAQNQMSVINAMSEIEHPTQALADLSTLTEYFATLRGINVLYIGEGNNTASALTIALSRINGAKLTVIAPPGYGVPRDVIATAQGFASESGAEIREDDSPAVLPRNVDAVYTSRWQTTGTCKPDPDWRRIFQPFKVTGELMTRVSKPTGTVFMHDLPTVRGEEVEKEVIDGHQSIVFRQAKHKLFSAMAALEWCAVPKTNLARKSEHDCSSPELCAEY